MEKKILQNLDFDPDFSEYNPIAAEFGVKHATKEKEGFFTNFLKKFTCRLLIQLD